MDKRLLLIVGLIGILHRPAYAGDDGSAPPDADPAPPPVIGIIIDDVGEDLRDGRRAIILPGPLAYSFLPYTNYVHSLAVLAHKRHKEVMLHLPMQAEDGRDIGPGGLTLDMTEREMDVTVKRDLAAVPYVIGVNNHMGSLLTRHPGAMRWLMEEIKREGRLFFIDSRTTDLTVAQRVAYEDGLSTLHRDVFLDDDLSTHAIARQFRRLLNIARRQGWALAIGHPHPATIAFLRRALPGLAADGVRLVPVSYLVRKFSAAQNIPGVTERVVRIDNR